LDGGTDAQDGNAYPGPQLQEYAAAVVGAAEYSTGTFGVFGDSLCALCNIILTPTSVTRAGNVATVVFATHSLSTGTNIRAFNLAPSSFNTADAKITRVDANTFTYPSVGPDESATISGQSRVLAKSWASNQSWIVFANSALVGALQHTGFYGHSGETTAQMLARVDEVADGAESWIAYLGGANDVVAATTAAATIANDAAIVSALVRAGKHVALMTIIPLGSGHAQFATATPKIIQINAARRALARQYGSRVVLVDSFAALVSRTATDGRAAANVLQTDNVHLLTNGARLVGNALASAMSGRLAPASPLTVSAADSRSADAGNPNIWPIGQWSQVDGGTKSVLTNAASPPGGSVAGVLDGYNVTASGGAGEVYIKPDPDGYGYRQVAEYTPSGAQTLTIQQESNTALAALVAAGERYRISFSLDVTGVTSALSYIRCRVQGGFDGATIALGSPMHSVASGAGNVSSDIDMIVCGPEFEIPPGACTSITVEIILGFTGATTEHVVEVGRMTFDRV